MSQLEAQAVKLQRARELGVAMLDDREIDFDRWGMAEADRAKVREATCWEQELIDHFCAPNEALGAYLPWSKTHSNIRLRAGELSIWAGVNGHGKALALDTPIPTPAGWSTMGELSVGDQVFDEQGQPCTVVAATEVMTGRPCYRLTFSDGTQIVADAQHQWLTSTAQARNSERTAIANDRVRARPLAKFGSDQSRERAMPAVRTTEEIARTLIVEQGCWRGKVNHSVAVAGALECLPRILPIDPYVLGAWLGDGSSYGAQITTPDEEVIEQIAANSGYVITKQKAPLNYGITQGLSTQLREAGLLRNKHIPAQYLRASKAQRLALLQGLMDTDGYASVTGGCEFTSVNKVMAEQVHELVLSLGMQASFRTGRAKLNGKDCGEKYRIIFTPTLPAFRLKRKLERCKGSVSIRIRSRFIVACEPIESVPVRCIQVSSPSHLFLASRAMIPTHNSMALSQVMLSLATQGEPSCIASLEMRPVASLARMARQAVGTEQPSPRAIRDFSGLIRGQMWLYDQQGTIRYERMLAVVRYAREALHVKHFVIDSLMKCGINSDDYNAQKRMVDALSTYARDSGLHIHLVAHSRKRESEAAVMDKFDIKGASEITDMADNVFTLWRNKAKEAKVEKGVETEEDRAAPDAVLACDKQRHGEWEGRIALWFNRRCQQFVGKQTTQPIDYLRGDARESA